LLSCKCYTLLLTSSIKMNDDDTTDDHLLMSPPPITQQLRANDGQMVEYETDNGSGALSGVDDDKTQEIATDIALASPPVVVDRIEADDEFSQLLDDEVEMAEDALILRSLLSQASGLSQGVGTQHGSSQRRVLPKSLLLSHEIAQLEEQQSRARHEMRESASQAIAVVEEEEAASQGIVSSGAILHELPREGRVICFDLETSGFSPIDDCIIEIGAVEVIDGMRTGLIFQSI